LVRPAHLLDVAGFLMFEMENSLGDFHCETARPGDSLKLSPAGEINEW
jgi:hypothetical protein